MTEYGRASAENDPQASAHLFAPDARYYENPFDEPIAGRVAIYEYQYFTKCHSERSEESLLPPWSLLVMEEMLR